MFDENWGFAFLLLAVGLVLIGIFIGGAPWLAVTLFGWWGLIPVPIVLLLAIGILIGKEMFT